MALRNLRPTTPGQRGASVPDFEEITRQKPEKSLVRPINSKGGRNATGRVTMRHQGGGHKRAYRLIDFVLSNISNSDISSVGLVTQYEPHDLMKYIGRGSTWDLDVNDGGVSFLTPYTTSDGDVWQKGTANAIYQHYRFIEQQGSDLVLILSGDHVYKMDYNDIISSHLERNAEITVAAFETKSHPERFGIINVDDDCNIIDFEEKPAVPKSNYASMGVYVFNREVLKELLTNYDNNLDFGGDVIPLAIRLKKRIR